MMSFVQFAKSFDLVESNDKEEYPKNIIANYIKKSDSENISDSSSYQ